MYQITSLYSQPYFHRKSFYFNVLEVKQQQKEGLIQMQMSLPSSLIQTNSSSHMWHRFGHTRAHNCAQNQARGKEIGVKKEKSL